MGERRGVGAPIWARYRFRSHVGRAPAPKGKSDPHFGNALINWRGGECELLRMHGHAYLSSIGHRALRKGRVSMSNRVYHVTTTTKQREPFFADPRAACAACHCFENHVLLRDARMLAWVLMPDHAHWLIDLGEARTLQGLVGLLKTFSARNVNRAIEHCGPIWAPAFHDHALREADDISAAACYIVANPLRAGLVERVGDYPYWNSTFLQERPSGRGMD